MSADGVGSPAWLASQRASFERYQIAEQKDHFELLLASQSGFFYADIDSADVDVDRRLAVGFCLPMIAQHLELAQPDVTWFRECSAHSWLQAAREGRGGFFKSAVPIWGRARRGVIALNAQTPLANITQTLAHEVRHCYQSTLPGFRDAGRAALEADAVVYASRWQAAGRCLAAAINGLPHGRERVPPHGD